MLANFSCTRRSARIIQTIKEMIISVSGVTRINKMSLLRFIALDFMRASAFSQTMRLNQFQIESLCKKIMSGFEEKNLVGLREGKEKTLKRMIEIIETDYNEEKTLENEVNIALDRLEKQETEGFDRHKMFKMMKKKMAEEKGMIL